MRFLCLCYYDAAQFAAMTPEDGRKLGEICAPHDQALRDSGRLRFVGSLALPEQSRSLRADDASPVRLENGPYEETGEPLGAFFMIEANDMEEAVRIAQLHPGAHIGHICRGGIEIRPIKLFDKP